MLTAKVRLILILALTNLIILLMARNAARQRALSLRLALGARPAELLRPLFTESFLLVLLGGALAWAFAETSIPRILSRWTRIESSLASDHTVLLFTCAVLALRAILPGIAPFRTALSGGAELALKTSAATAHTHARHGRARSNARRTADAFRKSPGLSTLLNLERTFNCRRRGVPRSFLSIRATFFFSLCGFACTAMAQQISVPQPRDGTIIGTVTDVQDDVVPGAAVVLDGGGTSGQQKASTNQNGLFTFSAVQPGDSYHVTIHANGFADWTSPAIQITPGQYMDLGSIRLTLSVVVTTVTAAAPEEIATQQVHIAEKQRALGFIPAFYAVYDPHPVPLTRKLKFRLAYRTATDSVTLLASAFIAGIDQALDRPDYGEGARGYGQRYGANYANTLTDTFVGGAILPSILHQDPRYFYQGKGSNRSRMWHAIRTPFVCKGDNGQWQPNFSSLGGYLASGALANTYYPASNRGLGLVFSTAGVDMSATIANALLQEFIVHRGKK